MRLPCYAMAARQLSDGRAAMTLTIGINNTEHLNSVIARLRKVRGVTSVQRT